MSDLTLHSSKAARLSVILVAATSAACAGNSLRSRETERLLPAQPERLAISSGVASAMVGGPAYDGLERIIVNRWVSRGPTSLAVFRYSSGTWDDGAPAIAGFDAWHGGAQLSPDGAQLYFESSRRSPVVADREDTDLWVADRAGHAWVNARPLGPPFDTPHNEHNVTVSARATICFNSNRRGITAGHDVLCARRAREGWENPQPLGAGVNGPSADVEAFIDPEERFLVFASNRAGGKGSFDLYISVNRDSEWQPAVSLGDAVNTAAEESSPTVSSDGRRLLFARSENGRNVLYECRFDPRWLDARP